MTANYVALQVRPSARDATKTLQRKAIGAASRNVSISDTIEAMCQLAMRYPGEFAALFGETDSQSPIEISE